MSKKKALNFTFPIRVYPYDIMISLNESWDDFSKNVTNKFGPELLDDFNKTEHPVSQHGLTYVYTSDSCLCCILKIHYFSKTAEDYGVLAHEIFHSAEFILRKCGLELNAGSHEAYAYLVGFITKEICKEL